MTKTKFYLLYGWSFVAYWILMLTPDPVIQWAAKHGFHGNGSRLWDFLLWMYGEASMHGYSMRYEDVQPTPGHIKPPVTVGRNK